MKNLSTREVNKIFTSFNNLRVLIIGDVMIDSYLWGRVTRISPEAPVPVVSITKKERRLGGAANVALNVQAMGATPILCSVIGVDKEGGRFLELLQKQKLSAKGILKSRSRITTVKTRVIGNNHQMIRVDEEIDYDITEAETEQFLHLISYLLKHEKIDVIIFEDYDKGLITPPLIQRVVTEARKMGVPTVVDPKRRHFGDYKGVTLFKPNLKELRDGLKTEFDQTNIKEIQKAVETLRSKMKIDVALITLSEHGIYISSKKTKKIIPAHIRNIADVSGAGDTVVSVASLCLALKLRPEWIALISNLAGGLVCEKVGVVPIDKEQLREETLELVSKKKE
ncbi:MAG: bifunctional heptose 7-phosphate kinase/heptose 1-phosphate adenyltransferase [Bacteroidia bacterium]